jgi:catechol 2,3-dioxygenase-like lactoylglutathione lyase family enzyme
LGSVAAGQKIWLSKPKKICFISTVFAAGTAPEQHRPRWRPLMGKLRHVAIQVPDLEKAATFYQAVFGLTRVNQVESPVGNAISLSDGTMNLTLLHFPEGTKGGKGGPDWAGLHHIGFVVEDEKATAELIKQHGGEFFMQLPSYPGVDAEKKFKDLNGIVFDVAEHNWRQSKTS